MPSDSVITFQNLFQDTNHFKTAIGMLFLFVSILTLSFFLPKREWWIRLGGSIGLVGYLLGNVQYFLVEMDARLGILEAGPSHWSNEAKARAIHEAGMVGLQLAGLVIATIYCGIILFRKRETIGL